ncbi:MAG: ubiquinol-cytochrome c reductase iron-sulfur subunit [Alphaproteobacteria bacterium]
MADNAATSGDEGVERRDFLVLAAGAMGVVGTASFVWPLIDSMNPSAEVLALSTVEVNLEPIPAGQAITVVWQGKPVFVRHRTEEEIKQAAEVVVADLRDPEPDSARVERPEWLVMIGLCTHLGCIPLGQKSTDPQGEFGGWFCPCHGSHYDTAGRIRKGPAPTNLPVPPYSFVSDTTILIG